jgi:hypothetical protein
MDRSGALSERFRTGETETEPKLTRRSLLAGVGSLAFMATAHSSLAETPPLSDPTRRKKAMDIKRNGSRPSGKGPEAWFTGTVRVDPLFQAGDPARVSGGQVTFEPGARTHVAQSSAGPDPYRHIRSRLGAMRGWTDRGSPPRRRYLVSAWREALAWRDNDDRFNTYSDYGVAQRQECRLDGKGQRRAIPRLISGNA